MKLNVGGTKFEAKFTTLTSFPDSVLAKMLIPDPMENHNSSPCALCTDSDIMQNTVSCCDGYSCKHISDDDQNLIKGGELYLDCDPDSFSVVLNYLRYGVVIMPPTMSSALILKVASSLGLNEMVSSMLQDAKKASKGSGNKETMMDWLKLNVGGQVFETSRATLTSQSSSSLAKMFEPNSKFSPATMGDGVYQLDACPRAFSVVLNWLRYRKLMLGSGISAEEVVPVADFFGLSGLLVQLTNQIDEEEESSGALTECVESCTEGIKDALMEVRLSRVLLNTFDRFRALSLFRLV